MTEQNTIPVGILLLTHGRLGEALVECARHVLGGKLPEQYLREMIDGRSMNEAGPHGSREMPVWGQRFRHDAQQTGMGRVMPERQVRQRIDALVTYLQSVQRP